MPRRDPEGDSWRCDNPACLGWTWVHTSTTLPLLAELPLPGSCADRGEDAVRGAAC